MWDETLVAVIAKGLVLTTSRSSRDGMLLKRWVVKLTLLRDILLRMRKTGTSKACTSLVRMNEAMLVRMHKSMLVRMYETMLVRE